MSASSFAGTFSIPESLLRAARADWCEHVGRVHHLQVLEECFPIRRTKISTVAMTLIAVAGNPRVVHEDTRVFRRGHLGELRDVAELDGVVLAVPQREADRALVLWLEQVVQRRDRSIVQIRSGGPDPFQRPCDVAPSRKPADLLFGKVEFASVLAWIRRDGMILDLCRDRLQLSSERLLILERLCEVRRREEDRSRSRCKP